MVHILLLAVASLGVCNADVTGPLTADFVEWLNSNGYGDESFDRTDLYTYGSFGGREYPGQKVVNEPVVFVHGNSDCALDTGLPSCPGWTATIEYFMSRGYTSAELYVTTWGDTLVANAGLRTHDCPTLLRLRKFTDAVLQYTGASKIDLITHSMGVTLGRKIVRGGVFADLQETCNLGDSLAAKVDTFVGLAGANYGLCTCQDAEYLLLTCDVSIGFWPGDFCGFNILACLFYPLPTCPDGPSYSQYLTDMNEVPGKEGAHIYSVYSEADDIILNMNMVWGRRTSVIPGSNYTKVYTLYTHMETKTLTAADQYLMVVNHTAF